MNQFNVCLVPKREYYDFKRPQRCNLLVDSGVWQKQKESFYPMAFYYSNRERTCKSTHVPVSVFNTLGRNDQGEELQRNLFQTLDDCMDTCAA